MASELEKAINALVQQAPGWKTFLPPAPAVTPIPAQRGVGRQQPVQGSSGGGGGTLTVRAGPALTVTSSDGIFQWEYSRTVIVTIDGVDYTLPAILP